MYSRRLVLTFLIDGCDEGGVKGLLLGEYTVSREVLRRLFQVVLSLKLGLDETGSGSEELRQTRSLSPRNHVSIVTLQHGSSVQ